MKTIEVPTREQVDSKAQGIFDQLHQQLGMVPNLYATMGYSSNALENYLNFSHHAGKGTFSSREIEAIKLAVSEVNNCAYCLAAHTAIAKMNGFSEEETLDLRSGTSTDPKLHAIANLAADIARNRGKASEGAKAQFFAQGYDEKALIDLAQVTVDITFTNYVHGLTEVPVDFPAAQPVPAAAAV